MVALKSARALSNSRIRVEFDAPVDSNDALLDVRNYRLAAPAGSVLPTILSVDLPNQATPRVVELLTSEQTTGARYAIAVNCASITTTGSNRITDGDMELNNVTSWTAQSGATLTKQSGARDGGSGVRILRVADADDGAARQAITGNATKTYRLLGYARGGGSTARARVDNADGVVYDLTETAADTNWHQFGPLYFDGFASYNFELEKTGGGAHVEFDDVSIFELTTTANTGVAPITASSVAVSSTVETFVGLGTIPTIKVVIARSATTAEVVFDEPVIMSGDVLDPSTYGLNSGLVVTGVEVASESSVLITTSTQVPGTIYTLTVGFLGQSVLDNALNALSTPAPSPMLGWIEKPTSEALLNLKMYQFLNEGLRDEDQKNGEQLVERYLLGPQAVWDAIVKTIFDLPKLWSTTEIPDDLVQYQKRIVGWTRDLDHVTSRLEPAALRRLIAASVAFWNQRGPEDAIEDILRLTTSARLQIVNWFDLRAILDETELGEEFDGTDPWLLTVPGEGPDAQTYTIRIVDDGTLDRNLVRGLAKLTRPGGERVLIIYLALLDLFTTSGDNVQWDTGALYGETVFEPPSGVDNGEYFLGAGGGVSEHRIAKTTGAFDWTNYVATWRASGSSFTLYFYWTAVEFNYNIEVFTSTSTIFLNVRTQSGTVALAAVNTLTTFGWALVADVHYTFRIQVGPDTPGSSTNRLVLFVDGVLVINVTDPAAVNTQGSVGFGKRTTSDHVSVERVEVFLLPVQSDFLDINS